MNIIEGRIESIGAEQQVTEKFKKLEFVVEIPGEYPQLIACTLSQGKCDLIRSVPVAVGDKVKVGYNLRGRRDAKGRVWNTIDVREISVTEAAPPREPGSDDIPF